VRFADQEVCKLTQWAHCFMCCIAFHSEISSLAMSPDLYLVLKSLWDVETISCKCTHNFYGRTHDKLQFFS
jgi:hypothetical protein